MRQSKSVSTNSTSRCHMEGSAAAVVAAQPRPDRRVHWRNTLRWLAGLTRPARLVGYGASRTHMVDHHRIVPCKHILDRCLICRSSLMCGLDVRGRCGVPGLSPIRYRRARRTWLVRRAQRGRTSCELRWRGRGHGRHDHPHHPHHLLRTPIGLLDWSRADTDYDGQPCGITWFTDSSGIRPSRSGRADDARGRRVAADTPGRNARRHKRGHCPRSRPGTPAPTLPERSPSLGQGGGRFVVRLRPPLLDAVSGHGVDRRSAPAGPAFDLVSGLVESADHLGNE